MPNLRNPELKIQQKTTFLPDIGQAEGPLLQFYRDSKAHPMFGKTHSPENRKKFSELAAKRMTERTPFLGKKHTA